MTGNFDTKYSMTISEKTTHRKLAAYNYQFIMVRVKLDIKKNFLYRGGLGDSAFSFIKGTR